VGALMNVTVLFIAERGGRRKWGVWQRNDYIERLMFIQPGILSVMCVTLNSTFSHSMPPNALLPKLMVKPSIQVTIRLLG
jgi:hypothetical protein